MADVSAARRRMSSAFKTSIVVCAAIVVLGLIDTLGSTLYVILNTTGFRGVVTTIGAALATFAGVAAYGRQLLVLFGGNAKDKRPRVSMSIVSWIVAMVIVGAWLVTINVGSHAIAWQFEKPSGYPASVTAVAPPKLTSAEQIVIEGEGSERTIKPFVEQVPPPAPSERMLAFALKVLRRAGRAHRAAGPEHVLHQSVDDAHVLLAAPDARVPGRDERREVVRLEDSHHRRHRRR